MNILVVTRSAWRNDNNTGNTMTNLFSGMTDNNIYSLCLRSQQSQNEIQTMGFNVSEQQMLKYWKNKGVIGEKYINNGRNVETEEKKMYEMAKKKPMRLLWFFREIIWSISPWENERLVDYIKEIKPDLIFMSVFGCWYPHKVLRFIKKYTNAKVVLFHADDNYTLKQYSLSPVYWLYRFNLRKWVKNSVVLSDMNYAISYIQKKEYEKIFKKEFRILYKGQSFEKRPEYDVKNEPLKLVYTGNLSLGRYKSLSMIGKAISEINRNQIKVQLDIYTLTPLSGEMRRALDIKDAVNLMGGVPNSEISKIQEAADVLVHVEAFDLKNKLAVRQSFSTKIVDYLAKGKCILAVGPDDVSSIDYFIQNDAAIVADSVSKIKNKLEKILCNRDLIREYGNKAWECGRTNHQLDKIQKELYEDFEVLVNEGSAD